MPSLLASLLLCIPAFGAAPKKVASQASAQGPGLSRKVTIIAHQMPVPAYVDILGQQARVNFEVEGGLDGLLITSTVEDGTLAQALKALASVGIKYAPVPGRDEETYAVGRSPGTKPAASAAKKPRGPALERKVTISAKDMPGVDYTRELWRQTDVSFLAGPDVDALFVNAELKARPLREALAVLEKMGVRYTPIAGQKDAYALGRNVRTPNDGIPGAGCAFPKINISVDASAGMPLTQFFDAMGEQAGVTFAFGPGLERMMFRGGSDDEPIENMVNVLAGTKGLRCQRRVDGAFLISARGDPPLP